MRTRILAFITLLCLLISCNKKEKTFTVSGLIVGTHDETLYLERMGLEKTEIVDSVKLGKAGKFSFTATNGKENPDFYRLRINDRFIPFIIDSTEQIVLNTKFVDFGEQYTFTGSSHSASLKEVEDITRLLGEKIVRFEKKAHLGAIGYEAMKDSIDHEIILAKSNLRAKIVTMPQSPVAYFILFKQVFDTPLFDINDPDDQKLFGAVATNYEINYPNTVRAEHLKKEFLTALKMRKTAQDSEKRLEQIVANLQSTGSFEINLPNNKGELVKLSSMKGKVTLLCFSALQAEYSPALTIRLGEIYRSLAGKPFDIYQVCFDADENFWRNSAANLPWICVRERALLDSDLILKYNIQQLPTLYLIDKEGDIIKRFDQIEGIESAIKALL